MGASEDFDRLREAARDVAYEIAACLGLVALVERHGARVGLRLRPWVTERRTQSR